MSRIDDYALLGDLHTGALVGRDGSVDWLCLPRFDSPACFAALLDTPAAGRWLLAPASGGTCTRRGYRGDTLVLESIWETPSGTVKVIDFMPPRDNVSDLVRIVEGVSGAVAMQGELRLRFDYGRIVPWVRRRDGGIHAVAGPDGVWLATAVPLEGRDFATFAEFTVRKGERVPFVLTWAPSHYRRPRQVHPEDALLDTVAFWEVWSAKSRVTGRWREAIQRSLITLKAMTYAPTGGIVAAITTSLPEQLGGTRNWDYRYCWLRDSTYVLQALLAAGYVDEARDWREWLLRAIAGEPDKLQVMYAVDGTRRLPEVELDWLDGYEQSRPVRIGNAAAEQLQLDVSGEVLDCLYLAREAGLTGYEAWDVQVALLDYLEGAWQQPDNGVWEVRGPRQHFVHSKVMAWVAFDRMVRTVHSRHLNGSPDRWAATRDAIHAEVCERGYDERLGSFTQAYGSKELDAGLLLIPRVGFLPPEDPRVAGTVDAVSRELTVDGLVRRYHTDRTDDGLPPGEGVFLACSFWLVDALHALGRQRAAVGLFERLLGMRNDVGLLSEEWDPVSGRHLGNTPQAFSHVPLVVSGMQLESHRHRRSDQVVSGRSGPR